MIIDCHTHIGKNQHINKSVKELLTSMDKAKVDQALVFACPLADCSNEWLAEQIKPHRDRLHGVAAYDNDHFRYVDLEKFIIDNQMVGIKFYTGYQHYYPYDLYDVNADRPVSSHYYNPLQICSDLQIPAIFHCGDCLASYKKAKLKYAQPVNIDEAAVDYDDVKFIIAHMGYPWHRDAAQVCYKNSNVYADISGFVYGDFTSQDKSKFKNTLLEFLDIADADKLLFGTDCPISNQDSYIEALEWVGLSITNAKVSQSLSVENLSKNVKKVFGLNGTERKKSRSR